MKLRTWVWRILVGIGGIILGGGIVVAALWWYFHPAVSVSEPQIYTRAHGRELTLTVSRPTGGSNGLGGLVLLSGSPKSTRNLPLWIAAPLLRRGYTVFGISHGSQPEFTVMEIVDQMHRAARFVRHHAAAFGIDPQRLAVAGGSSGGHLFLMFAHAAGQATRWLLTRGIARVARSLPWPVSIQ
jgi:hypothetical protein